MTESIVDRDGRDAVDERPTPRPSRSQAVAPAAAAEGAAQPAAHRAPDPDRGPPQGGHRPGADRPGTGKFTLNGRTLEEYFPSKVHQQIVKEPLTVVERIDTLDVMANLRGGGVTGQAGALRLAIARALIELEVEDRPALKKAGFLTRDARVKESKKYGLKKARKAPQYSKR